MTQENRQGLDQLMKAFDAAMAAQKHFAESGNIEGAQIAQEASNKIYLSMEAAMRTCKRSGQAEAYSQGGKIQDNQINEVIETLREKIGGRNDIIIENIYFNDDEKNPAIVLEWVFPYGGSERDYDQILGMSMRWVPGNGRVWEDGFWPGQKRYRIAFGLDDEFYGKGGRMSEADYYANGGEIEDLDIDIDDDSIEVDDYAQGGKIRSDYGTWVVTDKGIREKVENAARIANVEIVDVKANDDYDADMFLVRKPSDARKLGSAYITTYGGLPAGGMTTRKMNQVREDGSFGSQKMEFGGQIELPL